MWVFGNLAARRAVPQQRCHFSPALRFLMMPRPAHRYSFRLCVFPNGRRPEDIGFVSGYLVPLPDSSGPDLEWPIRLRKIRLKVLAMGSVGTSREHGGGSFRPTGADRAYFERHAPPVAHTKSGKGFSKMIAPERLPLFVIEDSLVLLLELLADSD